MLVRVAVLAFALLLAGCVAPGSQLDAASTGKTIHVVDPDGAPIPYATWTIAAGDLRVGGGDTGLDGTFEVPAATYDLIRVSAPGYSEVAFDTADAEMTVQLARAADDEGLAPLDPAPGLRVLPPHTFEPYTFGPEALCGVRNTCGLSEPVIEAAPGDVLYASSTCCVGGSPPVWVSRDGGATWSTLDTPGVREAVGIEGDFAIDTAGNVYFTDILVGAMWITSWDAEGNWRHTTPVPFAPLVDRPWVRAGAEDVVYFLYNTGRSTSFHVSTDGGVTFSPIPTKEFPAGLGTIAQGPELEHLWVVAGMQLYESTDGGRSWTEGEEVPLPDDAGADDGSWGFAVPAVDPQGRVLVAYDLGTPETGYAIVAAVREPDGTWSTTRVTETASHIMPWPEAGPAGGFAMGWYGTDDSASGPDTVADDAQWYAFLAASYDGGATWQRTRADPAPVLEGPMLRRLLDFVQVDLDERGAAHYVYSHLREGGNNELTSYVRTTVGLGMPQRPFGDAEGSSSSLEAALAPLARVVAPN